MYLHLDPDTYEYNKAETQPRYTKSNDQQAGKKPGSLWVGEWGIISRWKQRGEMMSREDRSRRGSECQMAETHKTEELLD